MMKSIKFGVATAVVFLTFYYHDPKSFCFFLAGIFVALGFGFKLLKVGEKRVKFNPCDDPTCPVCPVIKDTLKK